MDKALTWFIRIWIGVAFLLILAAIAGAILTAQSAWDAWSSVASMFNPFNIGNFVVNVLLVSPAVGAYMWRESRREKHLR